MKLVKTSLPQCPCGNVPTGKHRDNLQTAGFCLQTPACNRMNRQANRALEKGWLEEKPAAEIPREQRRIYTDD